jgi:hypothetical protein
LSIASRKGVPKWQKTLEGNRDGRDLSAIGIEDLEIQSQKSGGSGDGGDSFSLSAKAYKMPE